MKWYSFLSAFLLGICIPKICISGPDLDISPLNSGFEVLRRIQSRGRVLYPVQHFPQNLEHMRPFLKKADLTEYDQYRLDGLYPFNNHSLVQWRDTVRQHGFNLSPIAFGSFLDTTNTNVLGGIGLRVFGDIQPGLVFFSRGGVFTETSSEAQYSHQFDPDYGESCSVEKGSGDSLLTSRTCAQFEYYLLAQLPWLDLKVGRDHLHMGPGYFSSLTASRNTPPYYFAEARIDFADWLYVDNYFLKMTDTDHSVLKYAHIHRFEFRPAPSLSIAFQDAVIYQQRDLDPAYLIPLVPLAFAEDNAGGRDNDAMSVDFMYTALSYVSFWGEVFIDDLLGPGTFFDDFWENRWAVLGGFQAVAPWEYLDADIVVEYSRVEPWTYNGREPYTSFRHYNVPSASKLGPDSWSLDIQASYRPIKVLQIRERVEWNVKGTQNGAVLGRIHQDTDETTKEFLKGNALRVATLCHEISGYWNPYLNIRVFLKNVLDGDNEMGAEFQAEW